MATATEQAQPARKVGMISWLALALAGLLAIAAGFSVPMVLSPEAPKKSAAPKETKRPALIPFGDVVVNLGEERLTRYLRAKLLVVVDETHQKTVTDLLAKQKPFLKSWLISYLSDQSLQEVSGAAGVNRIRRDVRDQFNAMLFPDGSERIQDILFDEFVVQ
jgi:flagellar basal body-associated protein FliL